MTGTDAGRDFVGGHVGLHPAGWCDVEMDGSWAIGEGVCNGGYVMAVLHEIARSVLVSAGASTLSAVAAHGEFLAPTPPGPVRVNVVHRVIGRSLSRVELTLHSGDRTCVRAGLAFGVGFAEETAVWCRSKAPPLSAEEGCVPMPELRPDGSAWPPLYRRLALRLDPSVAGFLAGAPSGRGELKGWLRLEEGRISDAGVLLLALDSMPPATVELDRMAGRSPTVRFDAHLYSDAARLGTCIGPLIVRQQVWATRGIVADQHCAVWDAGGRLLASATQLNWLLP